MESAESPREDPGLRERIASRLDMAVVIISVGAPPELTRAISSIQLQSMPAELIVVNSGGGDVTRRLPPESQNVSVLSFEEVLWPGAARNRGIEATTAPYIAFLASDCVAEPDWISARLKRHGEGAAAVASSVVNSRPGHLVAVASHLALFVRRLPAMPASEAQKYGASYSRDLFDRHGLFREDLRIGEDTEFRRRVGPSGAPVWAPEVRTVHQSPTLLGAAVRDQYRRGQRSGRFWPQNHKGSIRGRIRRRLRSVTSALPLTVSGRERVMAYLSLPLVALCVAAFECGAQKGKRKPDPVTLHRAKAEAAMKGRRWQKALDEWTAVARLSPGQMDSLVGSGTALLRLGRFEDATAVFSQVRDRWPALLPGHEGVARAAAKRHRWQQSLEAWTAAHRISPDSIGPQAGRGTALLSQGRLDEAEDLFRSLRALFPDNPIPLRGLARLAAKTFDWQAELALYDELWTRFEDTEAIREKVVLLVRLERLQEAGVVVDELRSAPRALTYVRAAVPYLQAVQDWAGMVDVLSRHEDLVVKDHSLLTSYVFVLCTLGRARDAIPIILKSRSGDKAFLRSLQITALIRSCQFEEAYRLLREVWEGSDLGTVPGTLLAVLTNAAWYRGGASFASAVLDRIEHEAPQTRFGDAARIALTVQRVRLESLSSLYSDPPSLPAPATGLEAKLSKMAANVALPAAGDSDILRDVCSTFVTLRKRHPAFYPDPSFVLTDALEVATRIVEAADARRPFSLIRLGDGEGNILPYRDGLLAFRKIDMAATQRTWWGSSALDETRSDAVARQLADAIHSADVVGIPELSRFCRTLASIASPAGLDSGGKNVRGLLAVMDFMVRHPSGPMPETTHQQVLTSCHIHQSLAWWGLWDLLIPRFGAVSLITCHASLAGILAHKHDVVIKKDYRIPPEQKYSAAFRQSSQLSHYPHVFFQLQEQLSRIEPGDVVLVAAGILGKIYCQWIKEAGGIAIDVGSAADFWCNFDTRGIGESAYYNSPPDIRERLALLTDDPRIARLFGLTAPSHSGRQRRASRTDIAPQESISA